jgi:transposase
MCPWTSIVVPDCQRREVSLTKYRGFSSLKAWGLKIAKRRGHSRACVAVARRLAVIMHAMWRDGTEFRFKDEPSRAPDRNAKASQKLIAATA